VSNDLIIKIIIHHVLNLDRPVSSASNVFQDTFVKSVYNSVLFLPSCCCPFLLHVVANLICIVESKHVALISHYMTIH